MAVQTKYVVTDGEKDLTFFLNDEEYLYIEIVSKHDEIESSWTLADKEEVQYMIDSLTTLIKEM